MSLAQVLGTIYTGTVLLAVGLMAAGVLWVMLPTGIVRALSGARDEITLSIRLLASGLSLIGLCVTGYYASERWIAASTRDWIPVPGVVIHSELRQVMQPRSTNPGWRPEVHYRYQHGGVEFEGDRVGLGKQVSSDREGSQAWLDLNYPLHAQIQVWVDPATPQSSTLSRQISPWNWALLAAGLMLAGVGGYLLRLSRHSEPPPAPRLRKVRRRSRRSGEASARAQKE